MASTPFKVLIAVDPSDIAENAAQYYFAFVHKPNYQVKIFYCAPEPKLSGISFKTPMQPPIGEWNEELQKCNKEKEQLEDKFYNMKTTFDPKMQCEVECKVARKPGEGICDEAHSFHANLLVVGNRGLNAVRRTFMGSVSDYVLHHAPCPVMVVPKGSKEQLEQLSS